MNQKSIFESQEEKIEFLREKVATLKDSILEQSDLIADLNYFNLQGNENAMTYLENAGHVPEEIENYIRDWIYDQNLVSKNNPLVPFEGMHGGMKINKIKFLNHRWILADFTDGKYWGEMLLEYTVTPEGDIDFNTLGSLIYPQ